MKNKIQALYRDVVYLTNKQNETIPVKAKEVPNVDECTLRAWKGVQ